MPGYGVIITQVYTSRGRIPIPNALVTITADDGSGDKALIGFRYTNENGKIDPILIQTPDIGYSLSPSETRPFSLCDIRVESPGFGTVLVRDAQVFPDGTSIQDVALIPVKEGETDTPARVIVITPQNL